MKEDFWNVVLILDFNMGATLFWKKILDFSLNLPETFAGPACFAWEPL